MRRFFLVLSSLAVLACGGVATPSQDELTEEVAERLLEAAAGEDVEIELDGQGGTFTIGDQVITATDDGSNITMQGSLGNFEATLGDGEIPADWAVPIPAGTEPDTVMRATTEDGELVTVVVSVPGSYEEHRKRIVTALEALGEVESQVASDDGLVIQARTADETIWHVQLSGSDGDVEIVSARIKPPAEAP